MGFCKSCGTEHADGAAYCGRCGYNLTSRCSCGAELTAGSAFCQACGARTGAVATAVAEPPQQRPYTPQPASVRPAASASNLRVAAHVGTGVMVLSLFLPWLKVPFFGDANYIDVMRFLFSAISEASRYVRSSDTGQAWGVFILLIVPLAVVIDAAFSSLIATRLKHFQAGIAGVIWSVVAYIYLTNNSPEFMSLTNFLGVGFTLFFLGSVVTAISGFMVKQNRG